MNDRNNALKSNKSSERIALSSGRRETWIILAMVTVTVLLVLPVSYHRIYSTAWSDFPEHVQYAKLMLSSEFDQLPSHVPSHPLYQFLLLSLHFLSFRKAGLFAIALGLQVLIQVGLVLIIYYWLGREYKGNKDWLRAIFAITLTIVSPIMLLAAWDGLFYLGYIGLATYHNPTIHLLKPIALVSFLLSLRIFAEKRNSVGFAAVSAVLLVLSALVKPNFLMCLLPALLLLAFVFNFQKRPVDWRLLLLAYLLPGFLVLSFQYAVTYFLPMNNAGSVVFDPLGFVGSFSGYLFPKFILSTLFPLLVLVFNFRRVLRYNPLVLAWLAFLASLPQMYLLAETGVRAQHGNFLWGAQVTLFILFAASLVFLWREKFAKGPLWRWDNIVTLLAYLVHVAAGLAYYLFLMISNSYY